MAAALTPELEQPIGGFTYKTGCSGRAQLSTGQRKFLEGICFALKLWETIYSMFWPDVVNYSVIVNQKTASVREQLCPRMSWSWIQAVF